MKSYYQYIKEAYNLIKKERYANAVVTLEHIIQSGLTDPYPLLLLSISYLHLDKFGKADTLIKRLEHNYPEFNPGVELRAFLKLKSSPSMETALSDALEYIDRYPENEQFLKTRKDISYCDNFKEFQKEAKLLDYVTVTKPPHHLKKFKINSSNYSHREKRRGFSDEYDTVDNLKIKRSIPILKIITIMSAAIMVTTGVYFFYDKILKTAVEKKLSKKHTTIDRVTISGNDFDLIKKYNIKKKPVYYYSAHKMKQDFVKSRKFLKEGKYNKALYLLNSLFNSNISYAVKEKVEFLIRFAAESEHRTYQMIEYGKIIKKPYLYRGFALSVQGRVANLKNIKENQYFTLLIDYKNKKVLSGIAEIYNREKVKISNGDWVIVKGIFISTIGVSNKGYITAKKITIK